MDDHDLEALLGLADMERSLPGDREEELLAEILATYRTPNLAEADGPVRSEVVALEPSKPAWPMARNKKRRRAVLIAAAALVLLAVPTIVVMRSPVEPQGQVTLAPGPAEPVSELRQVGEFTDQELCAALDAQLSATGLVGVLVDVDEIRAQDVALVSDIAAELALRAEADVDEHEPSDPSQMENLSAAVQTFGQELDRGTVVSAQGAYVAARRSISESTPARNRLCGELSGN